MVAITKLTLVLIRLVVLTSRFRRSDNWYLNNFYGSFLVWKGLWVQPFHFPFRLVALNGQPFSSRLKSSSPLSDWWRPHSIYKLFHGGPLFHCLWRTHFSAPKTRSIYRAMEFLDSTALFSPGNHGDAPLVQAQVTMPLLVFQYQQQNYNILCEFQRNKDNFRLLHSIWADDSSFDSYWPLEYEKYF